jgi:hypothetical protein
LAAGWPRRRRRLLRLHPPETEEEAALAEVALPHHPMVVAAVPRHPLVAAAERPLLHPPMAAGVEVVVDPPRLLRNQLPSRATGEAAVVVVTADSPRLRLRLLRNQLPCRAAAAEVAAEVAGELTRSLPPSTPQLGL